jgi:hypothetical protein
LFLALDWEIGGGRFRNCGSSNAMELVKIKSIIENQVPGSGECVLLVVNEVVQWSVYLV